VAFAKRWPTGFTDNDTAKPCDAQALNAFETALLALYDTAPATDDVARWNGTKYAPGKIANANIATAAAIAYSKLALAGTIVNADIAAAAGLAISKLAGYPSDVTKVLKGDGSWGTIAGGGFGTTLPGSPSDGDEYNYIADATNGVVWRLKYKTSLAAWCFEGGPPLYAEVATAQTRSASTYDNLTTTGPTVTLPALAGDWDIEHGFSISALSGALGATPARMSYSIGASAAVDTDYTYGLARSSYSRYQRKTGLAASIALVGKYASDGTVTVTFENRWIAVTPVKVT
jgi:hypothetical protein